MVCITHGNVFLNKKKTIPLQRSIKCQDEPLESPAKYSTRGSEHLMRAFMTAFLLLSKDGGGGGVIKD